MAAFVAMWPVVEADDFKESMFPDPHNWTARCIGEVYVFMRGSLGHHWVAHGTPLSTAEQILRDGIVVGSGEHSKNGRPMHGWFCMAGRSAHHRIANARDRSTSNRCLEFQLNKWPTGWTVPCVLAWEPWPDTKVSHLKQFADGCWKSCIASNKGTQRHMPYNMALIINSAELRSYSVLQDIQPEAQLFMVCGGKTWLDAHGEEQSDSTYWAADSNNMPPSCGRRMLASALSTSDWSRKKSHVWFCRSCNDNLCNPVFWS